MKIRVAFQMSFNVPDDEDLTAEERGLWGRIAAAGRSVAAMSGEATGDVHHLADAADAIERLANVMRRARASAERGPEGPDNVL